MRRRLNYDGAMGVQVFIGRAGSGKTFRCFRGIADELRERPLGPPVIWLLPKQATFQAEHQLTCAAGLPGYVRARVLSFEQLQQEVLQECGGAAVPEVTQLGRQMIIGHLLRRHEKELGFFSKVARHASLAAKLEATFTEFEQCGREPVELESVAADVAEHPDTSAALDGDVLAAKLHDVQLIYRSYTAYIGQERLDPGRRMRQVIECIGASRLLRGATVYVDGFAEFTDFERRVLAKLAAVAARAEIMLLIDPASPVARDAAGAPHEMSLFHQVESTYGKLARAFSDEGATLPPVKPLHDVKRFRSPALAAIEREMFGQRVEPREAEPGVIELIEAPTRRAEVEHAARTIRELASQGLRFREIAVLVRQLDLYHDLINAAFTEHEIPYFVDRRRTMAHHPLLQCVRGLLAVAQGNWPHDAVMMLLKCGLGGLCEADADRLENYVLEHRLRGSVWERPEPWNWHKRLTRAAEDDASDERPDESARIDTLRREFVEKLRPLIAACRVGTAHRPPESAGRAHPTVRQMATAIFQTLSRLGVPEALSDWIARAREDQDHEQAGVHEQAWAELAALFQQMVDLLGDEPVTLADFREILEAGLETFDLALTPPAVDQVLVGQVDRTRTPEVRAVLLLGLNEGVFPHAARDTSILSDVERQELQRRQFEVDPGTERKRLNENLLGYIAFTRASERFHVSRAAADDGGRVLAPSPFWTRLREMFPSLTPRVLPRDERTDVSLIGTPRQLLTGLMRWARLGADVESGTAWPSLYQWLAEYAPAGDTLDTVRYRAWKAVGYDNAAELSPEIGRRLFPQPLELPASQVEAFAACPFRHFLKFGLRLQRREEEETVAVDLDAVFHHILENIVRDMLRRRADWASLTPEQARDWVRTYVADAAATLRGETMLSSARNRYLLARIERTLEQVIATQQAVAQRGNFKTGFAKVKFGGEEGQLPPLVVPTPSGAELRLTGRIDRVDLLDGADAFAVMDYRLHGGSLSMTHVYHGLSLQLLTYLLVLQAHGEKLAGKALTPAAAFYVQLSRAMGKVDHPEEAIEPTDPKFALKVKARGIFDGQYFDNLDAHYEGGRSDVLNAQRKTDGSFGYRNTTDVAEVQEFLGLLKQVQKCLGELGDRMLVGEVAIQPYRIQTETPCPRCHYKSVCRFDPALNRYHHIHRLGREDVLRKVCEGQS